MYVLQVKNNNGDIINFSDTADYTVYKIEGLHPPQVNIATSKKAVSDGSTINRLSVENRNIVIYLVINGDIEANRLKLYKYFPLKQSVSVHFTSGARDVCINGVVELIECDMFTNKQVAQISLICPQPYFKSAEDLVTYFNAIESLFEFPFSVAEAGTELSIATIAERKNIVNTGDVETGVIIKLYAIGQVYKPVIYDTIDRTFIKLNYTMQASDEIIINTNIDEKSITLIRDGEEYNAMGYLTPDSSWLVFSVGDNVFTYGANTGVENLQITFTTSLLYGGV